MSIPLTEFSDVVHANYGKIVVDADLVGAVQEVTMRVSGDMSTLSQVGSPHIVAKQPTNIRTDISFRVGFLDGKMLEKITGIPYKFDATGDLAKQTITSLATGGGVNSPLSEYILHMRAFDIIVYGFSGEGIATDSTAQRVTLTIPNVMINSFDIEFRAGDFWLSNVEGTADLMYKTFANTTVT